MDVAYVVVMYIDTEFDIEEFLWSLLESKKWQQSPLVKL